MSSLTNTPKLPGFINPDSPQLGLRNPGKGDWEEARAARRDL